MTHPALGLLALTVTASAAVAARRFVTTAGAYAAAGGAVLGVTRTAGATGELLPVDVHGVVPVVAGAAIERDDAVAVDAQGRVVTAAAGHMPCGRALTAAAAAGDLVDVLLTPNPGLALPAASGGGGGGT